MEEHSPEFAGIFCPLCQGFGADQYLDHGGLCVCHNCGCTFDPAIEPLSELPTIKADDEPWRGVDEQDRKDRLKLRGLEMTRVRETLRNVDGLRRLRSIPDEEWDRVVAEDERDAST